MVEYAAWIVFGKPPDKQEVVVIKAFKRDLATTPEQAIFVGLAATKDAFNNWQFGAVLLAGNVEQTKTDLQNAFIRFGVPENEVSDLIQRFALQVKAAIKLATNVH